MKHHWFILSLAVFAAGAISGPAAKAEDRASVPEKYKWNTADLYATDEAWEQKRGKISAAIPSLAGYQAKLGDSARDLYNALENIMNLKKDLSRLQVYAGMRSDEDTRVGKTRAMDQAARDLGTGYSAARAWLRPAILALGGGKIGEFIKADKRLEPYRPWLNEILRYAPHTLGAAEEKIAAQAGMMAGGPESIYTTFINADLPYPEITLSDGGKVKLDDQGFTKYRALPDRDDRDKVFKAFMGEYKKFESTLGAALNSHVKSHIFNKEAHKYNSSLEAALFGANVPVAVYKRLIADTRANLPTLHRYLKLRRRIMGLDRLRYEDLYAPLVKEAELQYTPEQAASLVMKAAGPLGPEYLAALKMSYDNRWVDFMPTAGKKAGAYSAGVYGAHPYQLQNFTGLYEEVSTLAHESGHSMHSWFSAANQPYITSDCRTFVAEVASTLNENLLFHYMLDNTKDKASRLSLLSAYLDGMRTTLFRQTLFAEFEWRIHELAEQGNPLVGENLSVLYLSLLREYYGDAKDVCKIGDIHDIEWACIPHFYDNFYVYQYATSVTAASKIAAAIRAEREAGTPLTKARDAYLKMLASGSAKDPIDLLKDAGVDMTTSEPFNAAIREMNSIMDEMEKIIGPAFKKQPDNGLFDSGGGI